MKVKETMIEYFKNGSIFYSVSITERRFNFDPNCVVFHTLLRSHIQVIRAAFLTKQTRINPAIRSQRQQMSKEALWILGSAVMDPNLENLSIE